MITVCPNCSCQWGMEEIDWGECYACGYPDNEDEFDDTYGWDDEDDDSTDPNDSRNL